MNSRTKISPMSPQLNRNSIFSPTSQTFQRWIYSGSVPFTSQRFKSIGRLQGDKLKATRSVWDFRTPSRTTGEANHLECTFCVGHSVKWHHATDCHNKGRPTIPHEIRQLRMPLPQEYSSRLSCFPHAKPCRFVLLMSVIYCSNQPHVKLSH